MPITLTSASRSAVTSRPLRPHTSARKPTELETQYYLGFDEGRSIIYGASPGELKRLRSLARRRTRVHGLRAMARSAGVSPALLSIATRGARILSRGTLWRVLTVRIE